MDMLECLVHILELKDVVQDVTSDTKQVLSTQRFDII